MTDAALTAPEPQPFPLRVAELNIGAESWPCAEDKLGRDKEIENLSPVLMFCATRQRVRLNRVRT